LNILGVQLDFLARQVTAGRFPALVGVIILAGLGSDYLSAAEIHNLSYLFSKQVGILGSRAQVRLDWFKTKA
jgi:hypothetical protein